MHTSVWRLQRGKHQAGCNPPTPKKNVACTPTWFVEKDGKKIVNPQSRADALRSRPAR